MKKYVIIPIALAILAGCSKNNTQVLPNPEPDSKVTLDSTDIENGDAGGYLGVTDVYAGLDTNGYKDQPKFSGIYKGKLHYRYGNYYMESISQVIFQGNNYEGSRGKGTFELKPGRVVSFADRGIHHADFNWALILAGSYRYYAKDDSLIMTKDLSYQGPGGPPAFYQYRLKLVSTE